MDGSVNMSPLFSRSYKGRFPFKLATTSYIYRDTWVGNVTKLAPYVDEIELVFFESGPEARPEEKEIMALNRVSRELGVTYNVHMPIDMELGSEDTAKRHYAVETVVQLYSLTAVLNPSTYTIHIEADGDLSDERVLASWQDRVMESLSEILSTGLSPEMVTVENLDYPFMFIQEVIRNMGLRICFDVGHCYMAGNSVLEAFDTYRDITDIVHLYGIGDAGEHRSLDMMPETITAPLIRRLNRFTGIVSIEVFSHDHLAGSLIHLEHLWKRHVTDG